MKPSNARIRQPDLLELLDEADDAVFLYEKDLKTLVYSNGAYDALFPQPGRMIEQVYPADRSRIEQAMEQVRKGESTGVAERLITESGVRWIRMKAFPLVDSSGNVVRIGGIIRDIHRDKEQYLKLEAYRQGFPDLGFLVDEDGRYLDVLSSAQNEDLLYRDEEQIMGKCLTDVLPARLAGLIKEIFRRALDSGYTQAIEYDLEVPRGLRYFELRVTPFRHSVVEKHLLICVVRDITEQKNREDLLRRTQQELEQALDGLAKIAGQDGLTGLANRAEFDRILGQECERGKRQQDGGYRRLQVVQ